MTAPGARAFNWSETHRLIPSRYSEAGTVLAELARNDADLQNLIALDGATNDRIQAEQHGIIGISPYELVYGIPSAHIVNAAFTHASDSGARFSDHTRGAWYAAGRQEASLAEVTYHKARRLADVICPREPFGKPPRDVSTFDDWLADFEAQFHVLDPPSAFADCLQPEPVPACYANSQILARTLLNSGSNGVVYPSVRLPGSPCLVCFRPALVYSPRKSERLEIIFTANPTGYDHQLAEIRVIFPTT